MHPAGSFDGRRVFPPIHNEQRRKRQRAIADIVEDKDGANQGRTGSGHGVLPGMRGDIVMGDDPDRYRSNTDRTEFQASRATCRFDSKF